MAQLQNSNLLKENNVKLIITKSEYRKSGIKSKIKYSVLDSIGRITEEYSINDSTGIKQIELVTEYDSSGKVAKDYHYNSEGKLYYKSTRIHYPDSIIFSYLHDESAFTETHYLSKRRFKWIKVFQNDTLTRKYKYLPKKSVHYKYTSVRAKIKEISHYLRNDQNLILQSTTTKKFKGKILYKTKTIYNYDSNGLMTDRVYYLNDTLYSKTLFEYKFK